ncbi:hypothetical protein [Streptomyces mesophilus]|uniref:hypothetical protein n=1 Tax=Streptomyces mesophilus TaxID=1775132 RepID=UPI003329BB78
MGFLIGILIIVLGTPLVRLIAGILFGVKPTGVRLLLYFGGQLVTLGAGAWLALSNL